MVNPTFVQRENSELDLAVAVGPKGLVMVEGEAAFVAEDVMVQALLFAEQQAQPLLALVREMVAEVGKEKFHWEPATVDEELAAACREVAWEPMKAAATIPTKMERYAAISQVKKDAVAALAERFEGRESEIKSLTGGLKSEFCRDQIISTKTRLDGRALDQVRKITIELGVLDRAHGSALFTRGETQAMVIAATLGTRRDAQIIEQLQSAHDARRSFMLHYNFPPFCVGEVKFQCAAPAAARSATATWPSVAVSCRCTAHEDDFPYTVRMRWSPRSSSPTARRRWHGLRHARWR